MLPSLVAISIPLLVGTPVVAEAEIPALMDHQGLLSTAGNVPLADGGDDLTFAMYASADAPAPLWTETVGAVAV